MKTPLRIHTLILAFTVLSVSAALALPALEGRVKDGNGRAVPGAEIRIQTTDSGSLIKVGHTGGDGRYSCTDMPANVYRVDLVINNAVKASIKNVRIALGEPTQLNFELKAGGATPETQGKHYVWVPSGTGSHIRGRWVEVDEKGNANLVTADPIDRRGSELIKRIQSNTTARSNH